MYDAGGALAAEYSTATPTTTPTTSYMTTDHLGSPRVITDKNGNVVSRRDFMPFGEEIYAGVGGRNTTQKYANFGSDNIRKRYTGYEKDDETQLDFAEARMYQNKHGRFTAVDPLMASASPENPQTFNRYSYTGNNPINYTDPSGLSWCKDSNGNVAFSSGACSSEQENVDGKSRKITSGSLDATNGTAVQGDVVTFNSNGTARILNPLDPRDTVAYSDATNTTVTATADEIATTDASVSGSIGSDFASAYITLAENNGLSLVPNSLVPQYNQHTERGQAIGNGISIVQGACEIGSGIATACAGGVGDVLALAFPPAEAVTLTVTAAGILEVTHGASVIGNTVYNMNSNQGSSSRTGPSTDPNAPHNKLIRETGESVTDGTIEAGGGVKPEKLIKTEGGFKSGRRPDILVKRFDGTKYGINIGKKAASGAPIKREAQAIFDLEGAGLEMYFLHYNK